MNWLSYQNYVFLALHILIGKSLIGQDRLESVPRKRRKGLIDYDAAWECCEIVSAHDLMTI